MEVQVETLDTHEAKLTIAFDDATIAKTRRDVAEKLSRSVRLPGFRPGKAPMSAVIAAVGGEEAFAGELADELARRHYAAALEQAKVNPYGPGHVEKVDVDPFRMIVRVPLEPLVDLKDYTAIRVTAPVVEVTDSEIEVELQAIREDNAVIEAVERPAELGDLIQAKITGETEGRTVISINNRKVVLNEERVNVPGLAAAVVGVAAGETKETVLVMPEDFEREDLRGKEVTVKIEMTSVSSRTLPELDDNLALAASKFATYAELRADVAARIRERKIADAARQYEDQILGTFADLSKVVFPPSYLEDRVAEAMEDFKAQVKQSGFNEFEDYLKLQGQTLEQLEEELRPGAERRSRRGLVMRELTKAENITVTRDEVEAAVTAEAEHQVEHHGADLREVTKILRRKENVDSIENQLLSRKVIDRMVNIARGL